MSDKKDILREKDYGISDARGVLSRLFRSILASTNVSVIKWDQLMHRYLSDPYNRIPQNAKDRSSARGNLNKELRRDKMTWKVFHKALRFLGPTHIRFEVHLTWPNKSESVHRVDLAGSANDPYGAMPEDETD